MCIVDPAKCANCGEGHTANYSQCPALLDYLSNMRGKIKPNNTNKTFNSNFRSAKQYNEVANKDQAKQKQTSSNQDIDQETYKQDFPALPTYKNQDQSHGMELINDFQTLIKEIEEINKLVNIKELLATVKKIKLSLKSNSNPLNVIAALANGP